MGTYSYAAINFKVYEIDHGQFHALRANNTYEPPGGAAAFPATVAIYQSGAVWKIKRVKPSTSGDGNDPNPETNPGTGDLYDVFEIANEAILDQIRDPGHTASAGFGPFPVTVAILKEGPNWRIRRVEHDGMGPDGAHGGVDDTFIAAGWTMGVNPQTFPSAWTDQQVEQYFLDRPADFPIAGTYHTGGNTLNDDTSGSYIYSGSNGVDESGNAAQDLYDSLHAQFVLEGGETKSQVFNNYDLWSSDNFWNDLDGFSNQLNNLPIEDRPSAISDWINENFDEDGKLWRYQEIRENINLSFDLNGIIDFSSNDGNDKEIRVHYSVESEYLIQDLQIDFENKNKEHHTTYLLVHINSNNRQDTYSTGAPDSLESNSTTGFLDYYPSRLRLRIHVPDQGDFYLDYESPTQIAELIGSNVEELPHITVINLLDDQEAPTLHGIEVIDPVFDYDAPADGLDIRIIASDPGGSGLSQINANFEMQGENGQNFHHNINLNFPRYEERIHQFNGKLVPRLTNERLKQGVWELNSLEITDRYDWQVHYDKEQLLELLEGLPYFEILGIEDDQAPSITELPDNRILDFSWAEIDPHYPDFQYPVFVIDEQKLSGNSHLLFQIEGNLEDTNGDGLINQLDNEQTTSFTISLKPVGITADNKIIARLVQDWFDEQAMKKIPLDADGKLKLENIYLRDVNGNNQDYHTQELMALPGINSEEDLLFSIVNLPQLDFESPQILDARIDPEQAVLIMEVREQSEIASVEIDLGNNHFGGSWQSYRPGDDELTITYLEGDEWLVEVNLAGILREFQGEAFLHEFQLNMLQVRDSNDRSESYDTHSNPNLKNLTFDESFAGDDNQYGGYENQPTLLAAISSNEFANENTTLVLVIHAPMDLSEGHIGLNNDEHSAHLNVHFDLVDGENVINAWREDDFLVVEVENMNAWFEDRFNPEEESHSAFFINNFHFEGIDGNHYEFHQGQHGPENEGEGNSFLFSKQILRVAQPWEDNFSGNDYNNIPPILASDTSIDFGGKNGIYDVQDGPLQITLNGFNGITLSSRVDMRFLSLDGEDDFSFSTEYSGHNPMEDHFNDYIGQFIERFRDNGAIGGSAHVTDEGSLVVEIDRSSLVGRFYLSELRFENGLYESFDGHTSSVFNSIHQIQGFGHFMIAPETSSEPSISPTIEFIDLSPDSIDIDEQEETELKIGVIGEGIKTVEAVYAQSFDPWHNFIHIELDASTAPENGNLSEFSAIINPDYPGIYHLVAVSATSAQGKKTSFYSDQFYSPMEESPIAHELPFEISPLFAKGSFPSVLQEFRPQGYDSAEKYLNDFYEGVPIPETSGSYDGPIDLDDYDKESGRFDFTVVDEIDLSNPLELAELASEHQDIWFQQANLDDGRYVWAISVENHQQEVFEGDTDTVAEGIQMHNLMVDKNGSVYIGNFPDYWYEGFGILIEENASNWKEERFDANQEGLERMYNKFPELRGPNAPLQPIIRTESRPIIEGNLVFALGEIITNGNNHDLELGMQFSDHYGFEEFSEILSHENHMGDLFEVAFDFSRFDSRYLYFRAFARNQMFESLGAIKRVKIEGLFNPMIAGAEKGEGGWEFSDWFGEYLPTADGWIYHMDLGWCYPVIDDEENIWLWMQDHGWVWTTPRVWPYMYRNDSSSWIYLLRRRSGPALIYDRMYESFMPIIR